jgi:hypothetical protein
MVTLLLHVANSTYYQVKLFVLVGVVMAMLGHGSVECCCFGKLIERPRVWSLS